MLGHGGDINQFHSDLSLLPEHELGIFVSFNSDPASAARSNLIAAFIDRFFPADYLRAAPEPADVELADYEGEYIPLRSNWSGIERLGILVNNLTVSTDEKDLLLSTSRGTSRWIATAEDRFVSKYRERNLVFERDASGAVSHMVVGSPLGTLQRVEGHNAPSNLRNLLLLMVGIAAFAILGYGYRVFARAPDTSRLADRRCFSRLVVSHCYWSVCTFTSASSWQGDLDEFALGMPPAANFTLIMMNVNVLIGLVGDRTVSAAMDKCQWRRCVTNPLFSPGNFGAHLPVDGLVLQHADLSFCVGAIDGSARCNVQLRHERAANHCSRSDRRSVRNGRL